MMKKLLTIIFVMALLLPAQKAGAAKKKFFTGKITFSISIDMDGLSEQEKGMLPTTMTMQIGENSMKTVLFTQWGKQASIVHLDDKTKTTLLDLMGQKFAINQSSEDLAQEIGEAPDYSIVRSDEIKEIAGMSCRRFLVKEADAEGGETITASCWVAEDLEVNPELNFSDPVYHQINGLLLEFELEAQQGMIMKFTATKLENKKVKSSVFEIPDDYQVVSEEELQKMFGGGL